MNQENRALHNPRIEAGQGRSIEEPFPGRARELFDAALSAAQTTPFDPGRTQEMTVLVHSGGALHLIADSDWPLESLAREQSAREAYRVVTRENLVRVEARSGLDTCVFERRSPALIANLLLARRA